MVRVALKREFIPAEREETVRQELFALLQQQPLTVRDISIQLGISEREVYPHLQHIQMSLQRSGLALRVLPAECQECGFVFTKRNRLKKPGRCPLCRSESISRPQYKID